MALVDAEVRGLKPEVRQYAKGDGRGLRLVVTPAGSKIWQFCFRWNGKVTTMALGQYLPGSPEHVTLDDARTLMGKKRLLLKSGLHPGLEQKAEKQRNTQIQATTVRVVAKMWMEAQPNWSDLHRNKVAKAFDAHLLPKIGDLPLAEITSAGLMDALAATQAKGLTTVAHFLKQTFGQMCRWACLRGLAADDPTRNLIRAIPRPAVRNTAILRVDELAEFRARLAASTSTPQTKLAIRLLALTVVRTKELRHAQWTETDFDKALWTIPAERMKSAKKRPADHLVPLSRQAIVALHELHRITGNAVSGYMFPTQHISGRTRKTVVVNPKRARKSAFLSSTTINSALERMGYGSGEFSAHGFRGSFSTAAHDAEWPHLHIEMQLAHAVSGISASYNHASYLEPRRRLLQWWADTFDGTDPARNVLPFPKAAPLRATGGG